VSYVRTGLGASGSQLVSGAGASLLSAAPLTGPAAPFVAVAGSIAEFLGAMGIGSGCGQTCVVSSNYANQAELLLKQNLGTYQALSAPRCIQAQSAAEQNFTTVWGDLEQQCSNPNLGDAGYRCIADRARGGKFDWFVRYYDPIAQDTAVTDCAAASASGAVAAASAASGLPAWALLAVAAGLLILAVR